MRLSIRHETRYTYQRAVAFAPHRLLLRPRDSHALRLLSTSLQLSPPGETRWMYDALGNCVCMFQPMGEADSLTITSRLSIERYPASLMPLDDPRSGFPIVYEAADRPALAAFMNPVSSDEDDAVLGWLRGFVGTPGEPALYLIQRLNAAIHQDFRYGERHERGVQTPGQTLALRSGTCRDFAWLMVEGLRRLGFAARFVTGYLFCPERAAAHLRGAASTHAWCEVFLPRLGWTEFDPTNGLEESADLIAVAIARTPAEAAPVSGAVIGNPGTAELHVAVSVLLQEEEDPRAFAA